MEALRDLGSYLACIVIVVGVLLATPPPADACTCAPLAPCESWFYTAVFQGEVIEILPTKPALDGHRTVRMQVDRTWRGTVPAVVTVMTEANSAACGYDFRAGVRYLVYAQERGDRRLWAGLCSVKPLDMAGEDLAFWKTRSDSATVGALAVYGTVTPPRGRPAARYTLVLRNLEREWKTVPDADGRYGFGGIPLGSYKLTIVLSERERADGNHYVELPDPRACAHKGLPRRA